MACNSESSTTDTGLDSQKVKVDGNDKLDTYHFATGILNGTIEPTDNKKTFDYLNRLSESNKDSLNFYFDVYEVILEKSDGALSEIMGQYTLDLIKFNPDFFTIRFEELEPSKQQKMISALAYEFHFSENPKQEISKHFSEAIENLEENTERKRKYIVYTKQATLIATNKLLRE